ncbi:AEC family transporter [Parahaliea maris]|uniref:AEC family transporter n=1 Tax=Parahaliea maris TaxID=2716870 RepID=A0A5C8ZMU1_9GAMM|nr:AEC family transporter [Parahaliea maris]TXS89515.1 AEC family transporter [Parahaliea maris]
MLLEIFTIVAPVFGLAAVGYGWARSGSDYPSEFITRLIMNVAAPCLFVSALDRATVEAGDLGRVVVAALTVLGAMLVLGLLLIRLLKLDPRVYLPPLLFPNNGNMGLSLCMFAFGDTGLALGLGIFMAMTVSQFSLGILIVDQSGGGVGTRLKELLRQPILYAAAFAVISLVLGFKLPTWAASTLGLMGGVTIPLMLMTLGVSLARLSIGNLPRALLVSGLRLGGGFLLGLAVVSLYGLEGTERGIVLLQAAMPVAVFNYLLAIRYRQSPEDTAGMVVLSTLLSFLTLPLLLRFVLGG